mgnify:CR=1 FL=1
MVIRLLITLLLLLSLVLANAGSPIIWFSFLHLILINLFIGLAESWILEKEGLQNTAWKIVFANYISMLVGFYFIAPYSADLLGYKDFWGLNSSIGYYDHIGFLTGIIFSFLAT